MIEMKKMRFFKNILIFFLFLVFFVSCSNISESSNQNTESVDEYIFVTAGLSSVSSARFALPSDFSDISNFSYYATLSTSTSTLIKGELDVDGKVSFTFPKPSSTTGLSLEVFAYKTGTVSSGTPEKTDAVLYAKEMNLSVVNNAISIGKLTLKAYSENTSKGSVALSVSLPDSSYSLSYSCSGATLAIGGTSPNVTVTAAELEKGTYDIIFSVKKGDEIVYIWREAINVYAGLETNAWISISNSGDTTSSSEKAVTQATINAAAMTTFYVRGENADWYNDNISSAVAKDENKGSLSSPFKTVQKAIEKVISANGDGSAGTEYTIYVDGKVEALTNEPVMKIETTSQLKLSIIGLGSNAAIFDAEEQSSVVVVKGVGIDLKLNNLKITGGSTTGNGAGICNEGKTLEIIACEISGNKITGTAGCGAGIYSKGSTVSLDEKTEIKDNIANFTEAACDGGGIQLDSGTLNINGAKISGNTANRGGGINTKSGCTINMTGGLISGNKSSKNGGGIVVYSSESSSPTTVKISGGTISGNSIVTAGNGKGIYVGEGGILELSGAVNVATDNDIFLDEEKVIKITGNLSQDKVSRISLPTENYSVGTTILSADTADLISANYEKFILNKSGSTDEDCEEFIIKASGTKAILASTDVDVTIPIEIAEIGGYSFVISSSIFGENISLTVKKGSDTVTPSNYKLQLVYGGDFEYPVVEAVDSQLRIPEGLSIIGTNYELYVSVEIDGTTFDKVFSITVSKN